MFLTRIKWMAVGAAVVVLGTWLFNSKDVLKKLTGSHKYGMEQNRVNPEFAQYIAAFTTGYISSGSTVKIKFASELQQSTELNTPVQEKLFSFEPEIAGDAYWIDGQTIEFRPKERLAAGQLYKASFHLNKLLDVKDELKRFDFLFQAVKQSATVEVNSPRCYGSSDFSYYRISGVVSTADYVEADKLEQILHAQYGSKKTNIKWIHNDKLTVHKFYIDSIERGSLMSSKLSITWDAKPINAEYTGGLEIDIPAKKKFTLLDVKVINDNDQHVQVTFSNPVESSQSMEGIIRLGTLKDVKYVVDNNQVLLYPTNVKDGSYKLSIDESVRDAKGQLLGNNSEHNVVFNAIKPAVRLVGNGVILPSSSNLTMPFEAVNLKSVDVRIVRIYENNILQFLQTNDLNGEGELARVGKKVIDKTINLGITNPADNGRWKKFSLDLNSLIKTEPGAIYHIVLSFKKSYSTYPCAGNNTDDKAEMEELKEQEEEKNEFSYGYYYNDYYDNSYYEEGEDNYDWKERDNPCNSAYYRNNYDRKVSRNLLASDLGLTVKKGNDGSFFVAASNLVTTEPMSGTSIEFYDYQQQLIISSQTNSDGQTFVTPTRKPYFIIAKNKDHRAYVKLDDGNSLSLSMYDVAGDAVQKGLKGFIYGERGVWRPGDTMFLTFILEDKLKSLPLNHPVMFELYNPQGQLYRKQLASKSVDGFYDFTSVTDKNAPTGNWNAQIKVGSVVFTKNIRIETIMPNRLKINVSVGDNQLIKGDETVSLHANWLTGAVAHNLQANVAVALSATKTQFAKFKDFNFDDPSVRFESESINLFDGKIDDNGDASFPCTLKTKTDAAGMLKANFATRVYEQGGAFSVDRFSITYSPFDYYAGVRLPSGESYSGILYTGKDQTIDVATVDYKGNPVSRGKMRMELYKLEWRWWWEQYQDELANYSASDYHKPVKVEEFSTSGGTAKIKLNIKEEDWGRYLIRIIDVDGGHSTSATAYFDWSNWMERQGGDNKVIANMLHFNTDKPSYKTGEEVKVSIPSPQGGRALVTIETGSRVLQAHWLETEKGNTLFKFKVTSEMAPNIYVHVSLIQPHAQTKNDLPIRLYGVVPVIIDDPETHLRPTIEMPATLVPEGMANITVGEENGKEMAYTLAVVDEGLLDITRFKTPDPWNNFYAREALGIKTWDVYDYVIGAYGGELERILSIGGDGSELSKDGAKANRFKPMVRFFGPYHLKKGEKKTTSFKMPMYVGSVRTMVISGYNAAYGSAEKTTPVKAPLMILGTLPRVLSTDEEVKLPVSVFGGDKNIGAVTVKVETNGLVQVVGETAKTTSVNKNDEKLVSFDLKVKRQVGIAKVKILASGGGVSTSYEMELDVRNPNPFQSDGKDFYVEAGKDLQSTYAAIGIAGTNSGMLELSTIPPVNLDERLHYLISYPHGCVEQTTSAVFAQLYLDEIISLTDSKKAATETNIKAGISMLRKFQLNTGGLSYWPGGNESNDWGTNYAGHFMMAAEKKGYTLPPGFKQQWVKYQQNAAFNWEPARATYFNDDIIQAYRLYTLALANQPAMSAMNRLREFKNLSLQARWRLAAAYALAGQEDEAEKLVNNTSYQIAPYAINYYTFGSAERDEAMILETVCLLNKKQLAFNSIKEVAASLSSKAWMSTQSTAYSLVAVSAFIKKFGGASAMQAECSVNGKKVDIKGNSALTQIPLDYKTLSGNFSIKNNGKGVLYVRLTNRGKPAVGTETEAAQNLVATVTYRDLSGQEINPTDLQQGTDLMMDIVVKNPGMQGNYKNLALSTYIPSGWEIHNTRLDDNESTLKNSAYTYQDIRDDRVFTYFDLFANETKKFTLLLNASYAGRYYLPGANIEAMYDNSIYARKKGQWINVNKQGEQKVAGK